MRQRADTPEVSESTQILVFFYFLKKIFHSKKISHLAQHQLCVKFHKQKLKRRYSQTHESVQ